MADIKAFSGYRPRPDIVNDVAALPYDVYNREEAKEAVLGKPLSFLRIDRPETQFADGYDMYAPEVYKKAHDLLHEMMDKGEYIRDDKEVIYIYELTMNGRSQTGLVACASIDDYLNGVIKKHENTREEKEQDRIRHVDVCSAQTGPIFLAYRAQDEINKIISDEQKNAPVYDFVSEDGIGHAVWKISNQDSIDKLILCFKNLDYLYIADGHHRAASAVKVGLKRREEKKDYDGTEEFNYFLSVLFPDEQLMIMPYNRVVKDLNGLSSAEFINKISNVCEINEIETMADAKDKGTIHMFLDDKWYMLKIKDEYLNDDPVDGLDVSILQNTILNPILGIEDPRTSDRIDFVGGIRGLKELERRCHEDAKVAFAMYPTSIEELFNVADANMLMPPKSTWFEPKLRSGIFVHEI